MCSTMFRRRLLCTTSLETTFSAPLRLEVEKITGHQSVRRTGGDLAVIFTTNWVGLSEPSWEREMDLFLSSAHSLRH